MRTPWSAVSFLLTTYCNRKCPHCCYRIPTGETLGPPQHYSWAYFEEAARNLRGVKDLNLAGGEPTLHPEFPRIATEFRRMFQPERLILCTNGIGNLLERYDAYINCFDKVMVASEPAEPKPRPGMLWMQQHHPDRLWPLIGAHRPLDVYGGGGMCCRFWMAAYANGRLYPCCIGPGIPGIQTILATPNWQEELAVVPRPCHACAFSQPDAPGTPQ